MLPNTERPEFVNPRTVPFVEPQSRGELPHLHKDGCSYFVTFRLWDAVTPATRRPADAAEPNTQQRQPDEIAEETEPPLQLGSCLLGDPKAAEIVQTALRFFDSQRYYLAAWCIMPNHAHAIVTPFGAFALSDVLHSWKSYTSHRINALFGRSGALWERESFDHLIRSVDHYEGFIRYTENNPVAAGLCERPDEWMWSSARLKSRG